MEFLILLATIALLIFLAPYIIGAFFVVVGLIVAAISLIFGRK